MNCTVRNTFEAQTVDITSTNGTESVVARLPEGATLKNIIVGVSTAFTALTTISIGIESDKTKFVNAASVASAGVAATAQLYTAGKGGVDIYLDLGGTPVAGAGSVMLEYYTKNQYTAQY
jgi:hypothetical protein